MKTPLPESVYQSIREKLLSGNLAAGTRLDYKQLALQLGVSSTPVREAVTRLASEGFLELVPRLGAVVRTLTQSSATEHYEIREAVETFAVSKAAERISPRLLGILAEHLAVMEVARDSFRETPNSGFDSERLREFLDADLAFHQTILFGARNPLLAKVVEQSQIQSRILYANRKAHQISSIENACQQHQAILDALEKGDGEAAAAAMREHIRNSLLFTLDHLEANSLA